MGGKAQVCICSVPSTFFPWKMALMNCELNICNCLYMYRYSQISAYIYGFPPCLLPPLLQRETTFKDFLLAFLGDSCTGGRQI